MATKVTSNKAAKPTKIKHVSEAPIMATEPEPARDTFPVSFMIIARPEDVAPGKLQLTLSSLPKTAQVCILLNKEGGPDEDTITPVDVAEHDGRTIRSRLWTYPKGKFDFAQARNLCHTLSTKTWGFWIDADEMLCEAQHDGIAYATLAHGGGVGGFHCAQSSMTRYPQIMEGKDPDYIAIKQLRLYRLNCGFEWEGYAHEQIAHSVRGAGYSIVDTTITVVHNGYSLSDAELLAKVRRNAKLIGRWLAENTERHSLHPYYTDVYLRELVTIQTLENKHGRKF
jgi:hypothetical protein